MKTEKEAPERIFVDFEDGSFYVPLPDSRPDEGEAVYGLLPQLQILDKRVTEIRERRAKVPKVGYLVTALGVLNGGDECVELLTSDVDYLLSLLRQPASERCEERYCIHCGRRDTNADYCGKQRGLQKCVFPATEEPTCAWIQDGSDYRWYKTACGRETDSFDGGYCTYCGKVIEIDGKSLETRDGQRNFGTDTDFPLSDTLTLMVSWLRHLHEDHDCDCGGWEQRSCLIAAAERYAGQVATTGAGEGVERECRWWDGNDSDTASWRVSCEPTLRRLPPGAYRFCPYCGGRLRVAVAPATVAEGQAQDRCEHGVLWSMECLSCGHSDFEAAPAPVQPVAATEDEPRIRTATVRICQPCVDLVGEECHTPECVFCFRSVTEAKWLMDKMMIAPIIDGERFVLVDEDEPSTPTPGEAAREDWPCPFCGEQGFDLIGLKSHLQHGDCEKFEDLERLRRL